MEPKHIVIVATPQGLEWYSVHDTEEQALQAIQILSEHGDEHGDELETAFVVAAKGFTFL